MYKRKLTALLSILMVTIMTLAIMVTPIAAYADYPLQPDDAEIVSALDYLRGIQAADGSIGSYSDSAWAIMAISAAGEHPERWQEGGVSVVDYLKDNASLLSGEFNLGTAYGRVVLAIIAAGENPSAFGTGDPTYAPDGDYLSKLKKLHNGSQFTDGLDPVQEAILKLLGIQPSKDPTKRVVRGYPIGQNQKLS